jgi:hypothetical protein
MHRSSHWTEAGELRVARLRARRTAVALFALVSGLSVGAATRAMAPKPTSSQQFRLRNACSNAAERAFRARWGHPPSGITLLGFTNRYDVRTNRCYLMVTYREGESTWFDVSDTQTGKTRAHIRVGSPEASLKH